MTEHSAHNVITATISYREAANERGDYMEGRRADCALEAEHSDEKAGVVATRAELAGVDPTDEDTLAGMFIGEVMGA